MQMTSTFMTHFRKNKVVQFTFEFRNGLQVIDGVVVGNMMVPMGTRLVTPGERDADVTEQNHWKKLSLVW